MTITRPKATMNATFSTCESSTLAMALNSKAGSANQVTNTLSDAEPSLPSSLIRPASQPVAIRAKSGKATEKTTFTLTTLTEGGGWRHSSHPRQTEYMKTLTYLPVPQYISDTLT